MENKDCVVCPHCNEEIFSVANDSLGKFIGEWGVGTCPVCEKSYWWSLAVKYTTRRERPKSAEESLKDLTDQLSPYLDPIEDVDGYVSKIRRGDEA